MKQIEFSTVGTPQEVVRYTDTEAPGNPGPGEVLVKVLAFPINPADLLTMQGIYPRLDPGTKAIGITVTVHSIDTSDTSRFFPSEHCN